MNYKQIIRFILPLVISFNTYAGAEEDYQKGAEIYYGDQDVVTAMGYLEPAAKQGHVKAQVLLAFILDKSGFNEQAVTWYQEAASTGDAAGEYGLALMLSVGEGVKADPKRALELMNSAGDKGHVPAMVWLADTHKRGLFGLPKSPEKSAEWTAKVEQARETAN